MACRYQLRRTMLNPASAAAVEMISLDKEIVKFGRNPDQVQIVLHSNICPNMISREHAHLRQIRNNDGSVSFYLFDSSLNGTYVNDIRVNSSILLHPGDTVKFGHVNGAAMAPGQPAPQPYAEFAYIFEKVPRAASSQAHTASIAAQQVQAAARHLAASPHSWPANPYAQLAATPAAAAAYFAATGFSHHPYLGPIPAGLLTPPPSAAGLSSSTTNQSPAASVSTFPAGCGPYSSMISAPMPASIGSHHQQQAQFQPTSAVMAAAAEAAAWLGVATAGQNTQSIPSYQSQQQTPSTAHQFPFAGHLNASAACIPSVSIGQQQNQHCQQQPHHHQHQSLLPNQMVNATNISLWPGGRKPMVEPVETKAMDSAPLSMTNKRQEQQIHQHHSTGLAFPVFEQRPQPVSMIKPSVSYGDSTISSNQTVHAIPSSLTNEKTSISYLQQLSARAADGTPSDQPDAFQQLQDELRKTVPSCSTVCETTPLPQFEQGAVLLAASSQQRGRNPVGDESQSAADASTRDSVVVESPSVAHHRTYPEPSACSARPTARVKQSLPASTAVASGNGQDEFPAAMQLSPSSAVKTTTRDEPQKAECDSSVPSPPEDPVRRKSTATSTMASTGANACDDDIAITAQRSSINTDLLRLAADARSRCLNNASGQDDVFDIEPDVTDARENADSSKQQLVVGAAASVSMYSPCGEPPNRSKSASAPDAPLGGNETTVISDTKSMIASPASAHQPEAEQLQPSVAVTHTARKKQRSNEVKRLYEDLQASYLFTQRNKKPRTVSVDSQSSNDSSATDKETSKDDNAATSATSSRSQSAESKKARSAPKRRSIASAAARPRRRRSTRSSSASSSPTSEHSDEGENNSDTSVHSGAAGQRRCRTLARTTRSAATGATANRNSGGTKTKGTRGGGASGKRTAAAAARPPTTSASASSERKRQRTRGEGTSNNGTKRGSAGAQRARRSTKTGRAQPPTIPLQTEDTWKYHDPSQSCAAGSNCIKPDGDNVDWVECDDCERWFHVNCVGCVFDEVKDEDTAFHCGCIAE